MAGEKHGKSGTAAIGWSGGRFYFANLIVDPKKTRTKSTSRDLTFDHERGWRQKFSAESGTAHTEISTTSGVNPDNTDHGDRGRLTEAFWHSYDGGNTWWKGK